MIEKRGQLPPPIRFLVLTAATLLFLWAGVPKAQESGTATNLQREVAVAYAEVLSLAEELRIGLQALVPSTPEWICKPADRQEAAPTLDLVPSIHFSCVRGEQSLDLTLTFDPSSSQLICQTIDNDKQGIADGRIKPDLFRFFEDRNWRIARVSVDLRGCAVASVALYAMGNRSEEAIAEGLAAIDTFAEAILSTDPNPLVGISEGSGYSEALARLMSLLDAQSRLLADLIPTPEGATEKVMLPSAGKELGMPLPMILWSSPSANTNLEVTGCRVLIELSASPFAISEAANTGLRWARPGGEDGAVSGAYIRRNTGRFVGRERVDGTGIEALVDGAALVRVVVPGNHACDAEPKIISRLFDEILTHDLRPFSALMTPASMDASP